MGKSRGKGSCQWSVRTSQSLVGFWSGGIAELGREFKLLKPPFSAVVGKASRFTK
jgi:hypothetical protein